MTEVTNSTDEEYKKDCEEFVEELLKNVIESSISEELNKFLS